MDVMARRRVVTELTYQILSVDFVGLAIGSVTRDFGGRGFGGLRLFLASGDEFVELLMGLGEAAPDGGAIAFELEGGIDEVAVLAFDFEEEPRERVFVDALIFAGEDLEVADVLGEAVFEGVLAGAVFAFLSLRSCFRGRVAGREGVFVGAAAFDGARRIAFGDDFVAGLGLGRGLAWGFGFGFLFGHGRLLSSTESQAG